MTYDGRIDYDGTVTGIWKRFSERYSAACPNTGSRARDRSVPRNDFRTDPLFNIDLRVEKISNVANGHAFGILFEAFNLTNRANVLNVNAVAGDDFGTPIAYLPGREAPIGVRYLFGC